MGHDCGKYHSAWRGQSSSWAASDRNFQPTRQPSRCPLSSPGSICRKPAAATAVGPRLAFPLFVGSQGLDVVLRGKVSDYVGTAVAINFSLGLAGVAESTGGARRHRDP